MPILDIFTILFKSNAKDVKKDMDEAEKSTKDFQKQIDTADKVTSKLAASMLKLGVEAVVAFASFEGLKSGITDAINFNAELEKTAQITGLSARQLAVYDATFSQFGGTTGEFVAWFKQASDIVNKTNGDVRNIIPNLKALANQMHALQMGGDEKGARQLFQIRKEQLGLPEDFYNTLIKGADAINLVADAQGHLINVTDQGAQSLLEFQSSLKELGSETRTFFTFAADAAKPFVDVLTWVLDKANRLIGLLKFVRDLKNGNTAGIIGDAEFLSGGSGGSGGTSGNVPLGIRNNNPGNLRSWGGAGQSGGFAQFGSLQQGLSAEQRQLQLYGGRGINTLAGIASTWAPSSENNTAAYIAGLVKSTGFSANQKLDLSDPNVRAIIANAINKQENGAAYASLITTAHAAIAAADSNPFNGIQGVATAGGAGQSISIGQITIHSPTGDPIDHARLFKEHLNSELSFVNANLNDGIKS